MTSPLLPSRVIYVVTIPQPRRRRQPSITNLSVRHSIKVSVTLPPVTSVDRADELSAKYARVMHWNQASFGPASRTKRRRIAEQALTEVLPGDYEARRHEQASSSGRHNLHTPPLETSNGEGNLSVKPTTKPVKVPWEDNSSLEEDEAKGTTLTHINTPQSMVEVDGSRPPFAASVASPSATFPTSATSTGRETSAEKETR